MIKFSVIMPSYLGSYPNSASDKETKFIRALDSLVNQSFKSWELIVIADGCKKTTELLKEYFQPLEGEYNVSCYLIPKQPKYSGIRNFGIDKAEGEYIIYLDTDDYFDTDYLLKLSKEITDNNWYIVDDIKMKGNEFKTDICKLSLGHCGTSNIIHKRTMKSRWIKTDYSEDYQFIKLLQKESDYKKLKTVGYYVCHIPFKYDV